VPRTVSLSCARVVIGAALCFALSTWPLAAQSCTQQGTALVLSGGGAKGIVHIGVIEVMDSLGIRPDLVVGTSMGAIVGALYASGYSGKQIDSLARSLPLSDIFRSFQPVAPRSLDFLQPLLYWEQGERGFNLQRSAASTAEANAITNNLALRGNLLARGNFDSLPTPFRAVATNLADRSLVVIGKGDLARALRASYSIPLIFPPEKIDGQTLGDGGLVANVPVSVARRLGAKRVIVSDATAGVADSVGLDAPLNLVSHLVAFLFHQPSDSLGVSDALVRGDLTGYADFEVSDHGVERLIEVGRQAARKALVRSGCTAAPISARTLPQHLDGFRVQGHSDGARSELLSLLEAKSSLDDTLIVAGQMPLPTGVRDAITARVALLEPQGRELLAVASVIGRRFRAGTLSLAAAGHGSVQSVQGDLKARIPLFSGQIEMAAAPAIESAIGVEREIGQAWLATRI